MGSALKISELKQKINHKREKNFETNLDYLLSLCESDIEKQFLLQIIFHLESHTASALESVSLYNSVTFLDDVHNDNYIAGIEFDYGQEHNKTEILTIPLASNYYIVIRVYPQFKVIVNNIAYRLDFAFYVERWHIKDDTLYETRKIAIECDGYDYHKNPDKFKQDKIRERALKSVGWKDVLRYSGSEIYEISEDLTKSHYNFKEILDIIMY